MNNRSRPMIVAKWRHIIDASIRLSITHGLFIPENFEVG